MLAAKSLALWVELASYWVDDHVMAATAAPIGPWAPPVDLSELVERPVVAPPPQPAAKDPEPQPPAPQPLRVSDVALNRPCTARRGIRGARILACSPLADAALSFRLSAPARVRVTLQRGGRGAAVRSLTVAGRAGVNRMRIPRGTRPLGPGRYLMRVTALGAGGNTERVVQVDAGTRR